MAIVDIKQLASELVNDPNGLGYPRDDNDASAALLNDRENIKGRGDVQREPIAPKELFSVIPAAEFTSLTSLQLQQFQVLLLGGNLDLNDANTQGMLLKVFDGTSIAKQAIGTLNQRIGSRGEVLFGAGTIVSEYDCRIARGG